DSVLELESGLPDHIAQPKAGIQSQGQRHAAQTCPKQVEQRARARRAFHPSEEKRRSTLRLADQVGEATHFLDGVELCMDAMKFPQLPDGAEPRTKVEQVSRDSPLDHGCRLGHCSPPVRTTLLTPQGR